MAKPIIFEREETKADLRSLIENDVEAFLQTGKQPEQYEYKPPKKYKRVTKHKSKYLKDIEKALKMLEEGCSIDEAIKVMNGESNDNNIL